MKSEGRKLPPGLVIWQLASGKTGKTLVIWGPGGYPLVI